MSAFIISQSRDNGVVTVLVKQNANTKRRTLGYPCLQIHLLIESFYLGHSSSLQKNRFTRKKEKETL